VPFCSLELHRVAGGIDGEDLLFTNPNHQFREPDTDSEDEEVSNDDDTNANKDHREVKDETDEAAQTKESTPLSSGPREVPPDSDDEE
jgi:hypothetical protein